MKIPIVNEQDEIICYKEREEATREDIRRLIALLVFNEKGEVLIAKRQSTKKIDPNLWGPSVAGTVDAGEEYDTTVIRETEEEIGLKDIKPTFLKKRYYETFNARRFSNLYYVIVDSKTIFHLQAEEVAEVKWITIPDLEKWVTEHPEAFTPNFPKGSLVDFKETYQLLHI